ncbi:MAG: PVC-type heme-binding CxxCH protein [Pirellulales bacterium]
MHTANWRVLVLLFLLAAARPAVGQEVRAQKGSTSKAPLARGPLSPEDALARFRLPDNLRIELVAAEPLVVDPIEARFDEDGRLWVVEMRDYPTGPREGQSSRSRIRVLEDRDGDGRMDAALTFADGLEFPTGLQPWRGGVIVTCQGEIVYLRDSDGDRRADVRETWYRGFAEENTQLRANHPRWFVDGRIYVAGGLRGGKIIDARRPDGPPVDISSRDFRFDPDGGVHEAVSGNGQFGLTFDAAGNRFICSNRNPLVHVVLEQEHLALSPLAAIRTAVQDVAAAGDASRVYPIADAWTTSTLHAGQFTAACGAFIYGGDMLPEEYRGSAFVCEPTGSLVHCEVVQSEGATFRSRRVREGVEFLASDDAWFRPVNLSSGPDGVLYVVDMYRAVIEHPEWMPQELRAREDLRLGDDRGRIWRIVRRDGPVQRGPQQLSTYSDQELAALLGDANAWRRWTAARLLAERSGSDVAPQLAAMLRDDSRPLARLHALWALDVLGALDDSLLTVALNDNDPRVRASAVTSATKRSAGRDVQRKLLDMAGDPDAAVRFRVALALGALERDDSAGGDAWLRLALQGADDSWQRRAARLAAGENPGKLCREIIELVDQRQQTGSDGVRLLVGELAAQAGRSGKESQIVVALAAALDLKPGEVCQRFQLPILLGLAEGLATQGESLAGLAERLNASVQHIGPRLEAAFSSAAELARDRNAPASQRVAAVRLLGQGPEAVALPVLLDMARQEPVVEVRMQAIDAAAAHDSPHIGQALLARFDAETPAVRRALASGLLKSPQHTRALLQAIEQGQVAAAGLDPLTRQRLIDHPRADVRSFAKRVIDHSPADPRDEVLHRYRAALETDGEARRGREVFEKSCASCHRIDGLGVNVGPDIGDSRTKSPEQLLTDILDPNRAIDANYLSYAVVTRTGQVLTGIVTSESAGGITLLQQDGKSASLLRDDLDQLRTTGVSLMPEGLEREIDIQAMADLIAFIKNWRYLDGTVPFPME